MGGGPEGSDVNDFLRSTFSSNNSSGANPNHSSDISQGPANHNSNTDNNSVYSSGSNRPVSPPPYAEAVERSSLNSSTREFLLPANYFAQDSRVSTENSSPEDIVEEQLRRLRKGDLPLTMSEASDVARQAQDAESYGLNDVASDRFSQAADALRSLARVSHDANERAALEMQAAEYDERRKELVSRKDTSNNFVPVAVPDVVDAFTDKQIKSGAQLMGTGMGAGVGLLLGVPIIGGAAGFFTANHLVTQDSENGARARELGLLGARVIQSTKTWNDKYKWTDRAKESAGKAWTTTKELNEKHDFTGKAGKAIADAGNAVLEFNKEHQVTQRVSEFAASNINRLSEQVLDLGNNNTSHDASVAPRSFVKDSSDPKDPSGFSK